MLYDGTYYLDDNDVCEINGYITNGDMTRLHHIANKNSMSGNNIMSTISFVIREYYKEHNIAEHIKMTTGIEHKEYKDFLEKLNKKR